MPKEHVPQLPNGRFNSAKDQYRGSTKRRDNDQAIVHFVKCYVSDYDYLNQKNTSECAYLSKKLDLDFKRYMFQLDKRRNFKRLIGQFLIDQSIPYKPRQVLRQRGAIIPREFKAVDIRLYLYPEVSGSSTCPRIRAYPIITIDTRYYDVIPLQCKLKTDGPQLVVQTDQGAKSVKQIKLTKVQENFLIRSQMSYSSNRFSQHQISLTTSTSNVEKVSLPPLILMFQ